MTPAELPGRLRRLASDVRDRGALDAADALAQAYQRSVVKSMRGPSPSAPGTPPGRRSGTLARSVRPEPARLTGDGRASSSVAPHTVYARIQQLGGDIYPVRAKALSWKVPIAGPLLPGKRRQKLRVYAKHVRLPARPYMVMTDERRRQCRSAAIAAVRRVVREALGG
jgi:phage gpG-like protein